MEMYVMRTYGKKSDKKQENQNSFPFWDYRSKRWNAPISVKSDGTSSGSSSISSNRSEMSSEAASVVWSDTSFLSFHPHSPRILVNIISNIHDVDYFVKLYQSFIDFIDPELRIIRVIERDSDTSFNSNERLGQIQSGSLERHNTVPSMAILLFVHEPSSLGGYDTRKLRDYFQQYPWKLHHEDFLLAESTIEIYPGNNQDFYEILDGYPLCGVRHIHYGMEHFRFTIFVSYRNWSKMVRFYKMLTNINSDYEREDFCLLTVHSFLNYDVQLVLKKLPPHKLPKSSDTMEIQFQVSNFSSLIQFLPNICKPLSNNKWITSDHDGNIIVFNVTSCLVEYGRTESNASYLRTGSLNKTNKGFYV